jgi:glycosyltransferase involved in cell wall biosynthesis
LGFGYWSLFGAWSLVIGISRLNMKILQVSHGLPPKENAGVELYTLHLSKALSQLGHQVHILCREADPRREELSLFKDQIDGLRVTRAVNNLKNLSSARAYYDNSHFDQAFSKILKEEKPDLVHFQHLFGLSASLIRIAEEEGYPVVFTLHDFFLLCHRIHLLKADQRLCPGPLYGLECASCLGCSPHPQDFRTQLFLKMRGWLPFPVIKWTKRFFIPSQYLGDRGYEVFHRYRYIYEILKKPDLILVPSQFVRKFFLKYYSYIEPKMRVVPLGIPPIKIGVLPQNSTRTPNGKIHFCYFGNILPLKGLHILIQAFKGLPEGRATLAIYGSRTSWNEVYYDRLMQQASGHSVDFRGPFQRENLSEAIKDQDVVVLASICPESFSFVIREANELGLPVIASRIGAIPEALRDGVNGFLFEPGNVGDLRDCMLRFIQEPELIQKMALKMPKTKSMEDHALELVEAYKGILEKR